MIVSQSHCQQAKEILLQIHQPIQTIYCQYRHVCIVLSQYDRFHIVLVQYDDGPYYIVCIAIYCFIAILLATLDDYATGAVRVRPFHP
jgi:hypothetical protein